MGLFEWIDTSSLLSILCEEAEDSAVGAGDAMAGDYLGSIPEMSRGQGGKGKKSKAWWGLCRSKN